MNPQDQGLVSQILPEVREIINNLLIVLSPKEKHIIENRFSLNSHPRATLEKIGKEFGVTRERIRQIEKNALRKLARNVVNTKLTVVNQFGSVLIKKYEGICIEDKLTSEIISLDGKGDGIDVNGIKLSLELDTQLERIPNTIHFYPFWKLKTIDKKELFDICGRAVSYLEGKHDVVPFDEIYTMLESQTGKKYSRQLAMSCLELDRRIKMVKKGIGLSSWRHINPRTLRDKILYILNEVQKPLHYVDIANRITEARFDKKVVNVQAVHNELIRDQQFVLIGRGIYALRKWGYEDGTVADVVASILRDKGPLDREKIIEEVLKRRQVKRITILLNLKNKPMFERVGRNAYAVKK